MSHPRVAPYGSWKSPITSDLIVSGSIGLSQPMIDGPELYWVEMRPTEGGRNVIVRRETTGETIDINPAPLNAQTRGHEYGGRVQRVAAPTAANPNCRDERIFRPFTGEPTDPV